MQDVEGKAVEPRDLPRVPEERKDAAGLEGDGAKAGDGWSEAGVEDPAFFIKLSDD